MNSFVFQSPGKIYCGKDASLSAVECCKQLKGKRVFVVTGKHVSKMKCFSEIVPALEAEKMVCRIYICQKSEPTTESVDTLAAAVREDRSDVILAVGGGSILDQAKAAAMLVTNPGNIRDYLFGGTKEVVNSPVPMIAVPTTAGSGSEVTSAAVVEDTERHIKLSVTNRLLLPRMVIADPKFHRDMPVSITVSTGMDALTHAVEAYTSKKANPFSDMFALRAIEKIAETLPVVVRDPHNLEARLNMEIASMMAATAFSNGGLGAVHGISQAIGGLASIPHGLANALLLPHVMEENIPGNAERFAQIGKIFGSLQEGVEAAYDAVDILKQWLVDYGIQEGLGQLGVSKEMVPRIVRETMAYRLLDCNPVLMTEEKVKTILDKAW